MTRSSGRIPSHHADMYFEAVSDLECRGGMVMIRRLISPVCTFISTSLSALTCQGTVYALSMLAAKYAGPRRTSSCCRASLSALLSIYCSSFDHLSLYFLQYTHGQLFAAKVAHQYLH